MGREAQLLPALLASCHLEGRAKQLGATPLVSITVSGVVTQTAHDMGRAATNTRSCRLLDLLSACAPGPGPDAGRHERCVWLTGLFLET